MTLALGGNLSELDRLLLELNAVQQSAPCAAASGTSRSPLGLVRSMAPLSVSVLLHRRGAAGIAAAQFWRRS